MIDPLLERYIQIINENDDESTMEIDMAGNEIWRNKDYQYHRTDGPAITWATSGTKGYYRNGKLHREDGPAIIYTDGTQLYYNNDKRHREGGPAVIYSNGTKAYYINNKLHRKDGPAYIDNYGTKQYWINGKQIAEDEFYANLVNKAINVKDKND